MYVCRCFPGDDEAFEAFVARCNDTLLEAGVDEPEALERLVRQLADAAEGFGAWFRAGIAECHGLTGVTQVAPGAALEPIFSWEEVLKP